jgi:lysyl endopeptidase
MILSANCKYDVTIFLVSICLFLNQGKLCGQFSAPGRPFPLYYQGAQDVLVYDVLVTENDKDKAFETEDQSLLKPAKTGLMVDVSFSPENSGTWDTLPDGRSIWRAAIHVAGASALSLIFAPYQVARGVKIFLYDRQQQVVLGAFTDMNNKSFSKLATAQIPGDEIIIEMQIPANNKTFGSLGISGIGCDFMNKSLIKSFKDTWFGQSGSCNVDINCISDSLVQLLKNAVVRIIFDGTERCTGTLINNTSQDGTNYVLTAEHCISDEYKANTAVFYFDYESPYCGGSDGSAKKSLSGATIKATGGNLDFTLLELLEPIPFTYKPYYAGWDYTGRQPSSAFVIHHPWGDVKKFSREDHPPDETSFINDYNPDSHWLVNHWEEGTTEKGSSGSALFDNYGHIVGTLSGGLADCDDPEKDYFQMFSHCWDDYRSQDIQLACWLDPLNEDIGILGGYDPYLDFWATGDEGNTLAWGSYSGHNSGYVTGFAEKFSIAGSKKIAGLMLHIARNYLGSLSSRISIKVWNGSDIPGDVLFEKTVSPDDLTEGVLNFIQVDPVVDVSGEFFAGYELEYKSPQDTFATFMAGNRLPGSVNSAFVYDESGWKSLTDYTEGALYSSFAVMPVVFDSLPKTDDNKKFDEPVIAYPVPADSHLWIEFKNIPVLPVQVILINLQGQVVLDRKYKAYQRLILIELDNLSGGIYLIRLKEGGLIRTTKVSVVK